MIVCICHRISDRDITQAVRSGAQCFETLQDETRLASSCGSCLDCAREVFDAAQVACGGTGVRRVIEIAPTAA